METFMRIILIAILAGKATCRLTVKIGSSVTLSCNIAENITWIRPTQSNSTEVSENWMRNGSDLVIEEVKFSHSGVYTCLNQNGNELRKWEIKVGAPPDRPHLVNCETHHSLAYMDCCWNVGMSTGIETNFTLQYRRVIPPAFLFATRPTEPQTNNKTESCLRRSTPVERETQRSQLPTQCCEIPTGVKNITTDRLPNFEIQLISENTYGRNMSEFLDEYPSGWIKPLPPRNVSLDVDKRENVYILTAQWLPPNLNIGKYIYKLRYKTTPGNGEWHMLEDITDLQRSFEVKTSHCVVEVQVMARPSFYIFAGFLSDWSESAINSTGAIKPTTKFRFENVKSDIAGEKLSLLLRWVEYGKADEPGFHYKIELTKCNGKAITQDNITDGITYVRKDLNSTGDCVVAQGCYCNVMGCADKAKLTLEPEQAPKYQADIWLRRTENGVKATWNSSTLTSNPSSCTARILSMNRIEEGSLYDIRKVVMLEKNVSCESGNLTLETREVSDYIALVRAVKVVGKISYQRTFVSSIIRLTRSPVQYLLPIFLSLAGMIFVAAFTVYACYHRRKIKHAVLRILWPKIPRPNLALIVDNDDTSAMIEMVCLESALESRDASNPQTERFDEIQEPLLVTEDEFELENEPQTTGALSENNNLGFNKTIAEGETDSNNSDVTESAVISDVSTVILKSEGSDIERSQLSANNILANRGFMMTELGEHFRQRGETSGENSGINGAQTAARPASVSDELNYATTPYAIPPYLSCSTSNGSSEGYAADLSSNTFFANNRPEYGDMYSENYAFFDSSWSGSLPQTSTPFNLRAETHLFFGRE